MTPSGREEAAGQGLQSKAKGRQKESVAVRRATQAASKTCKTTPSSGFLVYALYDVGLVVCACIITTYFAPAAAGSGIPDVKV